MPSTSRGASTAVRSLLAGTGASSALIAAALVSIALLAAFLAFDGLPGGGGGAGTDSFSIAGGADEALGVPGALAVAGAPAAVAAAPLAAPGAAAPGAAALATAPADGGPVPTTPDIEIGPPRGTPGPGGGAPPPADDDFLNAAVANVDRAVQEGTGVDPGLAGITERLTSTVDDTVESVTGDDLGGHVEGLTGQLP